MYQRLNAYRVPINVSILDNSAEKVLSESGDAEKLLEALGWGREYLGFVLAGLPPVKDSKKFIQMIKDQEVRKRMKEERTAKGYPDWVTPRKGIKGWMQKKFKDPKELQLPILMDIFVWLREQPRYQLLVAMHDALLSQVSSAEPRLIGSDHQLNEFVHPLAELMQAKDMARAERLRAALGSPLPSVSPACLIDDITGNVVSYDRKNGVGYFYGG
ncbi:MAG: hypothetical protein SFU85_11770 [Candidatus Methylacidiphilales bacterium]|nr:hypothetical protein [Candidatus Methylacidiphilales bacterium]